MPKQPSERSDQIFQLKITLDRSKPPIWRRVLVPADIRLDALHHVIQRSMGWWDCHLHHFALPVPQGYFPQYFGPTRGERAVDDVIEERTVSLSSLLEAPKQKLKYEYDFGDGCEHTVLLEKIVLPEAGTKYPVCIGGARACPPEDCGGVWGYADLIEIMNDPDHPEHEAMAEWLPIEWAPEEFDLDAANQRLRRRR